MTDQETGPKWAIYVYTTITGDGGWVVDTGVGGTYDHDVRKAKWWDSRDAAFKELAACELFGHNISDDGRDWPIQSFSHVRVR